MSTAQNRVNKRSTITMQQRIEILQKLEEGASMTQVATSYGICTKSVQRIKRNAVEVRQLTEQETNLERKRRRTVNCKDLDERLYTWFLEQRALGQTITDLILREKALEFVHELGGPSTFTASKGWVWRFKNRYGIRLLGVHSEKIDTDHSITKKVTRDINRRLEEEDSDGDYISNMDETERVWKNLSRRKPVHADEKRIDGKEMKEDHATDEFFTDPTDSYKLPNLSIHKNPSPLPVVLKSERNIWVDEKILAAWYNNHYKIFMRKNHLGNYTINRLLPIDSNTGYISPEENIQDNHFETLLLPTNTSILRLLDQESIEATNKIYHYYMLKCVFNFLGEINNFYKYHNIRNYFNTLYTSWVDITLANIKRSCRRFLRETSDTKEDASTVTSANLQELIYNIMGENIASNELKESLTSYTEVKEKEWQEQEDTKDVKENIESRSSDPNDEEIGKAFRTISAWAKTQDDFVKFHVKILKKFYDQQR